MAFRVALLGIYHESNTFIDTPTTVVDFENSHLLVGEDICREYRVAHHEIGGMLEVMDLEGIAVVPILFAEATPGGVITGDTYEALTKRMFQELDKAGSIDGCLVVVHGAAVSEYVKDMDGDWLRRLREKVGPRIPVVGTLDLHANVSRQMVEVTNALVAYKQNPHLDQRNRGKDAAHILVHMLKDRVAVVQHLIQVPVAISIEQQFTQNGPCKDLYEQASQSSSEKNVLAVSIALGFPYADVSEMGTSVIVVVEQHKALAVQIAQKLEEYIWQNRHRYVGEKTNVEQAIAKLNNFDKPALFLDMGDNIGGGAPGNGLSLIRALESEAKYNYFSYVYDPDAVALLEDQRTDGYFPLVLKGFDESGDTQLTVNAHLLNLTDGVFQEDRPRHGGQVQYDMGRTAIVKTEQGGVLMLSTLRVPPFSLKQVTSFGVAPEDFDVLIAKGVNAPIAAYSPVCKSIVQVDTPGVTQADMTRFMYHNRRKPLFPFEENIDTASIHIPKEYIQTQPFYTEGPVVDDAGNLYFTDLKGQAISRIDAHSQIEKWASAQCPNGQAIDRYGSHLVCESVEGKIIKFDHNGNYKATIVSGYCAGRQVHVPNDVIVGKKGGIFFTDSIRNKGKVFHIDESGNETVLAEKLDYPNGLILSSSEEMLYIAESYENRILCFKRNQSTQEWEKEVFADLPAHISGKAEDNLPDGIAFDSEGRLWVAHYGMGALQILSSKGDLLATVYTGFPLVSNVCFIPQDNSMFVTGGFGEPGPGAILRIELNRINQRIQNEDQTRYN